MYCGKNHRSVSIRGTNAEGVLVVGCTMVVQTPCRGSGQWAGAFRGYSQRLTKLPLIQRCLRTAAAPPRPPRRRRCPPAMQLQAPPAAECGGANFQRCCLGGIPPGPETAALHGCVSWRARCPAGAHCLRCNALACIRAVQHIYRARACRRGKVLGRHRSTAGQGLVLQALSPSAVTMHEKKSPYRMHTAADSQK